KVPAQSPFDGDLMSTTAPGMAFAFINCSICGFNIATYAGVAAPAPLGVVVVVTGDASFDDEPHATSANMLAARTGTPIFRVHFMMSRSFHGGNGRDARPHAVLMSACGKRAGRKEPVADADAWRLRRRRALSRLVSAFASGQGPSKKWRFAASSSWT